MCTHSTVSSGNATPPLVNSSNPASKFVNSGFGMSEPNASIAVRAAGMTSRPIPSAGIRPILSLDLGTWVLNRLADWRAALEAILKVEVMLRSMRRVSLSHGRFLVLRANPDCVFVRCIKFSRTRSRESGSESWVSGNEHVLQQRMNLVSHMRDIAGHERKR